MKTCRRCGKDLPLDAFGFHRRFSDGKRPECKECHRVAERERKRKAGAKPKLDPEVKFWTLVKRTGDDECWEWQGPRHRAGHGRFRVKGYNLAHRFAYELLVGPIPEGLELDHLCHNPPCVNPAHLEAVSHDINVKRGWRKQSNLVEASHVAAAKRRAATHCKRGHPFDAANTILRKRDGTRICRACSDASKRRYEEKKRAS